MVTFQEYVDHSMIRLQEVAPGHVQKHATSLVLHATIVQKGKT